MVLIVIVLPIFHSFVLSLAGVDADLLMEDESLVWTSKDVVIVLQHENEKIPLRWVQIDFSFCAVMFIEAVDFLADNY